MTKPKKKPLDSQRLAQLRERAESLLEKSPAAVSDTPGGGVQNLVQELRVYQAELEMQNEELRRVQLELEDSRDYFERLYDLSPVGYFTLDAEGVIHEANLTAARLLGFDRRTLRKKKLSSFIASESQDDFYLHRQQVFSGAGRQTCELQMRRSDRVRFTAHLETSLIPMDTGRPTHGLVELSDVTRSRQVEVALRASQAQLAGIIRSAMDAILTVNSQQRIVLCNEAAERMFGRAAGQLMGQPLDDLIPHAARRAHAQHVRGFGATGVTNRRMGALGNVSGLHADGTEFPIEASISQIEVGGEKLFTVILRDITERLRAEETLRRSEAELSDFFTESPLGMLWVGADGRILRVNRAQLEMLGCTEEEVFGRSIAEFHTDPEIAADALDRLAKRETLNNHRVRLRHQDGSIRHVLIDANGLWEPGRLVHSRWFVRDITPRVELEREILRISEAEQQRLGQELHDDVCQLLTGAEFLAHALGTELSAKSKADARRARRIARLLRDANTSLRDLSHGLAPALLDTEGLIGPLEGLALRTRQVFRRDCRVRCDQTVTIDDPEIRLHLYRIAQEAVGNAIKHGRAKRIEIRLKAVGDRVVLGIHDNGVGLPTTPRRGQGIGLRIMQYRAGLISGSLAVQRDASGGTSVVCSVHLANGRPKGAKKK